MSVPIIKFVIKLSLQVCDIFYIILLIKEQGYDENNKNRQIGFAKI